MVEYELIKTEIGTIYFKAIGEFLLKWRLSWSIDEKQETAYISRFNLYS